MNWIGAIKGNAVGQSNPIIDCRESCTNRDASGVHLAGRFNCNMLLYDKHIKRAASINPIAIHKEYESPKMNPTPSQRDQDTDRILGEILAFEVFKAKYGEKLFPFKPDKIRRMAAWLIEKEINWMALRNAWNATWEQGETRLE